MKRGECIKCGHKWSELEPDNCPKCSPLNGSRAASCSSITLNFRGDPDKPHDICRSDYETLSKAGFLFEFYPDAPAFFPTNAKDNRPRL